ncbi:MAG: thermonuclease family protein [Leptospirillia bacterium]
MTVRQVIDGDTVELVRKTKVRYIGIDTPEVRRREGRQWIFDPEPFALEAKAENARLVGGREIRLEFDRERTDRYGRLLAYVYLDDMMVNEQMLLKGLARARAYPPNLHHQKRLKQAEARAKAAGVGIWSQGAEKQE